MKKSFSPHWDQEVRRAFFEGNPKLPELLRSGREIELEVMSLVLFPGRIQQAWDDGRWGSLAYLAEFIAAGMPSDLDRTDPVLHRNLARGFQQIRELGWDRRLDPHHLRELEEIMALTVANQAAEGIRMLPDELLEVRRRITTRHLGG